MTRNPWFGPFLLSLSACAAPPAKTATSQQPDEQAWTLDAQAGTVGYQEKRYADCSRLYLRASEHAPGRAKADAFVSAGDCELKIAHRQEAMALFRKALETSPSYCDDAIEDANLQRDLAGDPQWIELVAAFKPACAAYLESINKELRDIYRADQDDRRVAWEAIGWTVVNPRDAARRERVTQLETSGQLRTADDYYHAAMIFQHGSDESSYAGAFRLATHAVELDPSFVKARWLAAASKDRYLMARSEPQLYGTQFKRIDGKWILWPVDPRTTDRQRALWGVESLESLKEQAIRKNAKSP